MSYTGNLNDELNILLQFNLATTQEGIKIHKTASPEAISATERLFFKGFITQADGGYLTDLGHIAAEHAQAAYTLLSSERQIELKPAIG